VENVNWKGGRGGLQMLVKKSESKLKKDGGRKLVECCCKKAKEACQRASGGKGIPRNLGSKSGRSYAPQIPQRRMGNLLQTFGGKSREKNMG